MQGLTVEVIAKALEVPDYRVRRTLNDKTTTTGKFKTREILEKEVVFLLSQTSNRKQIAKACGVIPHVVGHIFYKYRDKEKENEKD